MAEPDSDHSKVNSLPKGVTIILYSLRLVVGWLFFYEGLSKILAPTWSAGAYLELSNGPCAGFFRWLASNPGLLRVVDLLTIWGLMLIGLAVFLGFCTRIASAFGMLLLALFYLAQMPLIRTRPIIPLEGHYLLFDKNFALLLILSVFLLLPPGTLWGLDQFLFPQASRRVSPVLPAIEVAKAKPELQPGATQEKPIGGLTRRETLENLAAVPLLGAMGYTARKKYEWEKLHSITGATIKVSNLTLKDLKGELPQGTIGNLKVSRIILGGNLIAGFAHSRDLGYVPQLFLAYNTGKKIIETLDLAERAGVNTVLLPTASMPRFNEYRDITSSKMQAICQILPDNLGQFNQNPVATPEVVRQILADGDRAIGYGANMIYVNGAVSELWVQLGRFDVLEKALDHIKRQGYPAGLGGHSIEVPIQCERAGLQPDFYVKTVHPDNYWSAHPRENRVEFMVNSTPLPGHNQFHDNIWDIYPEKTVEVMHTVKRPWIGFKVLAAGAVHPKEGFKYAFESGADFICVGMFDYQIIEDVNIALDVLGNLKTRKRAWYA